MSVTALSGAVLGVEGHLVRVEVEVVRRLPGVTLVGLPSSAVRESAERVRSAIVAAGMEYPRLRVLINLAPADMRKEGTAFDLPIAAGVLAASGQLSSDVLSRHLLAGELSLDGRLRPIRGALPLAMMAAELGLEAVILPRASAGQAAAVRGLRVYAADSLGQAVAFLRGEGALPEAPQPPPADELDAADLSEVRGQLMARRALEIAAAGGHNLLMIGPPGAGKTMLAARLPTILPAMDYREALEATRAHSAAGLLPSGSGLLQRRPFRRPHHSVSPAGMTGGARLQPGELALAHRGVLFLDELPEFNRGTLETLRGPMEDRALTISRSAGVVRFPASFALVAAANPCPCGYLGHPTRPCRCTESAIERYRGRLSGPLMDRIDLHVPVEPVDAEALFAGRGEPSATVRARVEAARGRQRERYGGARCNAELGADEVRAAAAVVPEAARMLRDAVDALGLSGRAHDRLLRVARTIADLRAEPRVLTPHLAEAIAFRAQEASR